MRRENSEPSLSQVAIACATPPKLTDGAIVLRPPQQTDADLLASYGADKERSLQDIWIAWPLQDEGINEWASHCIHEWLAGWTTEGSINGPALIADEQQPFVGIVYFVPLAKGIVELVFGVLPSARGRGVASRMVSLAADWALTSGGFDRVELRISGDHAASQRVATNAGFRFEEQFETFVTGTGKTFEDLLYVKTTG